MAFRSSTQTQAWGLAAAIQQAAWVKQQAQAGVALLSGTVNVNQLFQLIDNLRAPLGIFNSVASIPGIGAYAQAQFDDPGYDVVAEFTAMVNALQACIDWIVNNFPADAQGFIQAYKLNADGSRTASTFSSAQTAGLASALNTLIAQIG